MTKRKITIGKPKNQTPAVDTKPVEEVSQPQTNVETSTSLNDGIVSITAPVDSLVEEVSKDKFTTNIVSETYPAGSKIVSISAPSDEPVKAQEIAYKQPSAPKPQAELPVKGTAQKVAISPGEQIWNEIKDRRVSLFTLGNRTISDYAKFHSIDPNQCFVSFTISAFLPVLEEAIRDKFVVEQSSKYILISRK